MPYSRDTISSMRAWNFSAVASAVSSTSAVVMTSCIPAAILVMRERASTFMPQWAAVRASDIFKEKLEVVIF